MGSPRSVRAPTTDEEFKVLVGRIIQSALRKHGLTVTEAAGQFVAHKIFLQLQDWQVILTDEDKVDNTLEDIPDLPTK